MVAGQSVAAVGIVKKDRPLAVAGENGEAPATESGTHQAAQADVFQHLHAGGVQAFPCKPLGRTWIPFQEQDPRSLARKGQSGDATHRTGPNDRYVWR